MNPQAIAAFLSDDSMETLNSSWCMSNPILVSQTIEWTKEENKKFERALAIFDEHGPDRWLKVAAMIPGKTINDVIEQYKKLEEDVNDIEAGRVPVPGYLNSSFTVELVDKSTFNEYGKRPLNIKSADQQRKKGVPWTEEEHSCQGLLFFCFAMKMTANKLLPGCVYVSLIMINRQFLMGLLKHGKGDWRNISRNFVGSKTPTQVASHAQKYFTRQQLSGVKDKRRPSIHDITILNLADSTTPLDGDKVSSLDQSDVLFPQQKPEGMQKLLIDWDESMNGSFMTFGSTHGDLFKSPPYEISSNGLIFQGQNLYAARIKPRNLVFQLSPPRFKIH